MAQNGTARPDDSPKWRLKLEAGAWGGQYPLFRPRVPGPKCRYEGTENAQCPHILPFGSEIFTVELYRDEH